MSAEDMHDDEIRARLGLAPLGRPMTVEERIEANLVRAVPEPFDADTEIELETLDMVSLTGVVQPMQAICSCTAARYQGDDGWDRMCPIHGTEAKDQ